jgi:lysophospholipase L1-like esterase
MTINVNARITGGGGQSSGGTTVVIASNVVDVTAAPYNAKPDAKTVKDARIALNSNVLNSASASFSASDVGKAIKLYDVTNWIYGVRTTIAGYISPTQVTLTANSPIAITAGDATATWGTNNATAIQAALDHAATLTKTLNINVNYPIGDGIVTVSLPTTALGSKYLIDSPLTVARNVRLDGEAMLYNNTGNGGTDTTYCIQLDDGAHIGKLLLDAARGTGITAGTTTGDAHSRFEHLRIWNPGTDTGQTGLRLRGFDCDLQHVWIKGGNVGINCDEASDIFFDTVYIMGAQTPIMINGCQNINFNKVALDTNAVNGLQIDTSHHIHANVMAFNNYDGSSGTQLAHGLLIGEYTGTKVSNIKIDYQAVQTGGVGMKISNAEDCDIKLTLSNALLFSNANGSAAFTKAIEYGTGNSGYLDIEAVIDGAIPTLYSGTKYGNLTVHTDTDIALFPKNNLGIGTISDFGGGTGVMALKDASVVPTTNPTNAAILYSQGGVPKFRFADGTVLSLGDISLSGDLSSKAPINNPAFTGNVGIGTSSEFGSGSGVVGIANATTAPTTNPTNAAVLYAQSGVPKFKFADGTLLPLNDPSIIAPAFSADNKKIVIFGSSTAAGVGSSGWLGTPNNGEYAVSATAWAGLFAADMTAKGYTIVNQSIGGTHTQSSLDRFYTDVVPHKPRFVLIATSIWNEPNFQNDSINVAQGFFDRTYKLCRMVEAIGAIPILLGPYPSWMADATSYGIIKSMYPILERIAPVIGDFLSVSDNGSGTWLSSLTVDYTHPNDAGHAAFYDTINETLFDQAGPSRLFPLVQPRSFWQLDAASSTVAPMTINLDRGVKSWSIRAKIRADVYGQSKAFLSGGVGATVYWRLRNPTTTPYTLTDTIGGGDLITSTVNPSDLAMHDVVVTYNHVSNLIKLYIDGALINSATPSYSVTALTDFCIGGRIDSLGSNAVSHTFGDIALWRAPLSAGDVAEMTATGRIPTKSLEALVTCSHTPNLSYAQNAAQTATLIKTPSVWNRVTDTSIPPTIQTALNLKLDLTGGTIATTWNAGGTTFTGLKVNITDTASSAASLLQDWQVAGSSKVAIKKTGDMLINGLVAGLGIGTNTTATAFGASCLSANTTGANGSAFGYTALAANTTGSSNTAIGAYSLCANTVGYQNSALGKDTLKVSTTGNQNTAFGNSALIANTSGSSNAANGFNALLANTSGSFNSGFGNGSLSGITTGTYNVGLGFNSGSGITTGSYNVVIGSYTGTLTSTSNTVVVADGQGNERFRVSSTGNMGLGTNAPTISDGIGLHISGKLIRLTTAKTPASATDTGNAGEICWDANYIYVCVASNSWRRTAIAVW